MSNDHLNEYVLPQVVDNVTNEAHTMVVREFKKIGEGAFGTVVQAKLRYSNDSDGDEHWYGPYAIKRVPAQTEYKSRELEILRVVDHPNVINLRFFFNKLSSADQKVYQNLVMECLPTTLQNEIKTYRNANLTLPLTHIKAYSFQLTRAMLYLHGFGISHRDIKPSNILIDPKEVKLKICDFGSAKKLEPNQPSVSYICSRYYRSPELIVGCSIYTTKIDVWGLGCVIAEMFLGRAVFQGTDPLLQLREISKLLGPPPRSFIFKSNSSYNGPLFATKLFSSSVAERFAKIFNNAPPDAVELLLFVLVYDPDVRPSPRRVLAHAFFDEIKTGDFKVYPRNSNDPISLNLCDFTPYELELLGSLKTEFSMEPAPGSSDETNSNQ